MSYALHENQGNYMPRRVWFSGTTALLKGQGVCFDLDYLTTNTGETATDAWEKRANTVAVPSTSNNMAFAGVASRAYSAAAAGQWIEIYEPGSVCEVLIEEAVTINSTMLTCVASGAAPGWFGRAGLPGRGSMIPLQTVAVSASTTSAVPCPVFSSLDGSPTVHATSKLVTKTAAFTYASTTALTGDRVHIHGGADVGGTASAGVTPGIYDIASRDSTATATLSTDPNVTASTKYIAMTVVRGHPTCLAYLMTGEESGLTQWCSAVVSNAVTPALMAGGTTFVIGGTTLAAGETTATVAASTGIIKEKAIRGVGTLTTKGVNVTGNIFADVTNGTWADATTIKLTLASGSCLLRWDGACWYLAGGNLIAA